MNYIFFEYYNRIYFFCTDRSTEKGWTGKARNLD